MDTSSGKPTMEELRRLVAAQRELITVHAARIAALEDSLAAVLAPAIDAGEHRPGPHQELGRMPVSVDYGPDGHEGSGEMPVGGPYEGGAQDGPGLGRLPTRGVFLRTAAAGAAGLAGASVAGWGAGVAQAAGSSPAPAGMIGSWIVSIVYKSRHERTRGLATITSDGGFMGSVSAYEQEPAQATPSRGTALHGSWVATGPHEYAINATRLHLSTRGVLLGVMSTQIAATVANDFRTWDGSFTFTAAHPDGHLLGRGRGTLHATRIPMPR